MNILAKLLNILHEESAEKARNKEQLSMLRKQQDHQRLTLLELEAKLQMRVDK